MNSHKKSKITFGKTIFLPYILLCIIFVSACGSQFSDYEDETILVTGLGDDFYVTPKELADMECISDVAIGQTEKAGTVYAYGPSLETFLDAYGYTLDDVKSLRTTAKDDYVTTLGKATWDNYTVILSVAEGSLSKALTEKRQPLRIVIPGGKSGNWTYAVTHLEFRLNSK